MLKKSELDGYQGSFTKWFKVFVWLPEILLVLEIITSIVLTAVFTDFLFLLIGIPASLFSWFLNNAAISPKVLQTIYLDRLSSDEFRK